MKSAAETTIESASGKSRLSRNVIALGMVSLFTDMGTEIIYPLLPLFLMGIGAGPAFIGIVEGVAETTASLLKLVAGWLSDKLRRRKAVVLFGYGISSLTRPLMAMATAPWHVLGIRFADRVGKGFRGAPRDALIADSTHPSIRGKAFGFHRAMDHFGAVVGPLIAFGLLFVLYLRTDEGRLTTPLALFQTLFLDSEHAIHIPTETYRLVFWAAVIPAALAFLTLIFFVREIAPTRAAKKAPLSLSLKPFNRTFKTFMLVLILFTLGNSSDMFLLARAEELGVSPFGVLLLWVVLHIVKSASSTPGSAWSDTIGRQGAIRIGWAVYAFIYIGFALANQAWHAWALFALYGVYFGLTEGSEKAFIADLVPSELRGAAYGIYGFAMGIAALPASVLFGAIWSWAKSANLPNPAQPAFFFGAAMALVAALLMRRVNPPMEGEEIDGLEWQR